MEAKIMSYVAVSNYYYKNVSKVETLPINLLVRDWQNTETGEIVTE